MEKLISRKEAAKLLGISIATLDAARNSGLISYVQYVQNGCVSVSYTHLIQAKLQAGKGAGYARWAKVFNLKQMAQTLNYLSEHGLLDLSLIHI